MGIPLSLLGKAGLPSVESMASDKAYDKYFKSVKNFEEFHRAFIDLCNEINTVLPGKHYKALFKEDAKKFFDERWQKAEDNQKKEFLIEFINKNVDEHKPNEKAMMVTGVVAPAAATYLKRTGENTEQLKKFRLHLIPNFVFVPTCTLLALAGVRALQIRTTTRS